MTLAKDIMSAVALVVIVVIGHIASNESGMGDVKGVISQMQKAISELIGWVNRQ